MPSRKAGSRHSSLITPYFWWLFGAFIVTALAVFFWQDEEGSPPAKPLVRRNPERIRETGATAPQEAAALLHSPLVVSPAASPLHADPFTTFLEAAKTDPNLLTRPVSAPDGEQMTPEAFKQALETAKPPERLPILSPFGSPR